MPRKADKIQFFARSHWEQGKGSARCINLYKNFIHGEKKKKVPKPKTPGNPLRRQGGNDTIKLIKESFFPIDRLENAGGKP